MNKIKKTYSGTTTSSSPVISINSIPSKSIKFNHSLDLKEDSFDLPLSKDSSSFMMDVNSLHCVYPPSTYPIYRDIPVEEETVTQEEKSVKEEEREIDKGDKVPEEEGKEPEEEKLEEKEENQQEELKEEKESDSSLSLSKRKKVHTDSDDELIIDEEGMNNMEYMI